MKEETKKKLFIKKFVEEHLFKSKTRKRTIKNNSKNVTDVLNQVFIKFFDFNKKYSNKEVLEFFSEHTDVEIRTDSALTTLDDFDDCKYENFYILLDTETLKNLRSATFSTYPKHWNPDLLSHIKDLKIEIESFYRNNKSIYKSS